MPIMRLLESELFAGSERPAGASRSQEDDGRRSTRLTT
jgi:hypothetical protein